ncbi:hypothetical protein G7072_13895 [Nocardioides sp. HDW12B]|uniref:hypothetical protein n=1 Tax=Nocardioides sp. HDW12B TaxID=2714939 RepID=UPI00140E307C|nr:hypothetical protein [Nocardioides sp. HDW12B]QIK67296.1 hypothetical protein G7072_13895 [Nocardioides sp. HDW12B]
MATDDAGEPVGGSSAGLWSEVVSKLREHRAKSEAALVADVDERYPDQGGRALARLRKCNRWFVRLEAARIVLGLLAFVVAWRMISWLAWGDPEPGTWWWVATVLLAFAVAVLVKLWVRFHGHARAVSSTWGAYQLPSGLDMMKGADNAPERYARAETNLLRYRPRTHTLALRARWRAVLDYDAHLVGELEGDFPSLPTPWLLGVPPEIWGAHRKVLAEVLGHLLIEPRPPLVPATEAEAVSRFVLAWRGTTIRGRVGASFAWLGALSTVIALGGAFAKAAGWD